MNDIRIGLVEDHPVMREILCEFVSVMPQVASCEVFESGEDALKKIGNDPPDLVLVDLSLPGVNGIELVRQLRQKLPDIRCAILTGHRVSAYVSDAFIAGAKGYMLKDDPLELEAGVRSILAGETFVSRSLNDAY